MQQYLAKNIIEIYRKYAGAWTALRGEYLYEKAWLDRFLAVTEKPAHGLDLGCGAGQTIAAYLILQGCEVTGVDSAKEMIGYSKGCQNNNG